MELDRFDIHKLPLMTRIMVMGSSQTGKTFLINHLWEHVYSSKCPYASLITKKQGMVEYTWPCEVYTEDDWCQVLEEWKRFVEDGKSSAGANMNHLIVLDDTTRISNRDVIDMTFAIGRHFHLTSICSVQSYTFLTKTARRQVQYVFVFQTSNSDDLREIHTEFCANIDCTYAQFNEYVSRYTKDFGCLVICADRSARDLKSRLKWYRA